MVWPTLGSRTAKEQNRTSLRQQASSALTLLTGRQEEHPACKHSVMRCWCGYLSGARCFTLGPQRRTANDQQLSYNMERMCADTVGTVPVLAHTINPCVKCTTQMIVLITKTFQKVDSSSLSCIPNDKCWKLFYVTSI